MCWTESLRYSRSDVAKFASPSSAALRLPQSRAGGQSLLVGLIAAIDEMAESRRAGNEPDRVRMNRGHWRCDDRSDRR